MCTARIIVMEKLPMKGLQRRLPTLLDQKNQSLRVPYPWLAIEILSTLNLHKLIKRRPQ